MLLIKKTKTILGIVLISLFIFGFSATSVNAYFDVGDGGGTTYTSTRSATITSTKSATMSGTASSTATATAKLYDFETLLYDEFLDYGDLYDINLHSSETRSATATASETRSATRSATRTRTSTISQAAADAAAQAAANAAALAAADAAALAAAQSAALAAAQSAAQSQAGIYASNFAIEEASLAVNYAYPSSPIDNSLVTIHGFGLLTLDAFYALDTDLRFSNWYGVDDIKHVRYYDADTEHQPEFDGIGIYTPIQDIALAYRNLLIRWHNEGEIKDNIDIMAHSMGGLVTRAMIKLYYQDLRINGITINHIATVGTPNYGVALATLADTFIGFLTSTQVHQMEAGSPFLDWLNEGDDTPHSVLDGYNIDYYKDIIWSTFAGHKLPFSDGIVDTWGIQLHENDVTNYGIYTGVWHWEYWLIEDIVEDLYYEMTKQGFTKPQSSETLPGDLTIEPLSGDTYRIKMVLTEEYNPDDFAPWCRVVINNKAYYMNAEMDDYRYLDEWERWVIVHEYYYNYFDVVIPQGESIHFYCMLFKENGCDWYRMTPINAFCNW